MPETINNARFRVVTMSLLADTITEDAIIKALATWDKGIKGSAYILHDKDIYLPSEVKSIKKQYNDLLADGVQPDFDIPNVGDYKPPHWHILLHFGSTGRSVDAIAKLFNTKPNMIQAVRGRNGFKNMLAYLTHITEKAQDKFQYEYDDIKGLRFPDIATFAGMETYFDFADAYMSNTLQDDDYCVAVMAGKMTLSDVKETNPKYYLDNLTKLEKARHAYINSLPTPDILFNFYVGPARGEQGGRIGKGIISDMLALSHLKSMFPDVDFNGMDRDTLTRQGYIYYAGGDNVALQDYDGQPIIIWDDITSDNLLKTFGGSSRLFSALDTYPKPIALNIKYGRIYLKNRINIFNGIKPYDEFIRGLCREEIKRFSQRVDGIVADYEYTDQAQARGRIPFFMSITPDYITAEAQLEYWLGSKEHNIQKMYENVAIDVAKASLEYEHCDVIGEPYLEAEAKIIEHNESKKNEKTKKLEFREIKDIDKFKRKLEIKKADEARKKELEKRGIKLISLQDQGIEYQ